MNDPVGRQNVEDQVRKCRNVVATGDLDHVRNGQTMSANASNGFLSDESVDVMLAYLSLDGDKGSYMHDDTLMLKYLQSAAVRRLLESQTRVELHRRHPVGRA